MRTRGYLLLRAGGGGPGARWKGADLVHGGGGADLVHGGGGGELGLYFEVEVDSCGGRT